ncbi:hypothetical protein GCM10012287_26650 [Streptomyces daqingensis]|uniref:Uncharacterized protein n=1 Tax=Streptomyces daqingensis TaxID=1472640 RepID=A0ABQ2MC59_9ACTN|nr:hypothetical protein [Streptomyces daqingensis]GGO49395.1 hypothetical protein GCM10012287_26650 [Streptomyces daqingensis]
MAEEWPGQAAYERRRAELDELDAHYEAMDHADYMKDLDELEERNRRHHQD